MRHYILPSQIGNRSPGFSANRRQRLAVTEREKLKRWQRETCSFFTRLVAAFGIQQGIEDE